MALEGYIFKDIKRKVRVCVVEEGKSPDECVQAMEEEYELTEDDKFEIREMANSIGKSK